MADTDRNYCGNCRADCPRNQPCPCCYQGFYWREHSPVRDAMDAYERRMPAARNAAETDAAASYGRTLTMHLLEIASAAMQDEGIDPAVRHRVLTAVIYGGSNPADVEMRAQEQARFAEYVETTAGPTPFVFKLEDGNGG